MDLDFRDPGLSEIYRESKPKGSFPEAVVKAFRKRIQFIRAARDIRDLYAFRSFRFERLKGNRSHQYSLRLNDQWRLIIELDDDRPDLIVVISIEDYH